MSMHWYLLWFHFFIQKCIQSIYLFVQNWTFRPDFCHFISLNTIFTKRKMEEEYDTDAFSIFVIAFLSIYLLIASVFIFKRLRRFFSKEPPVVFLIFGYSIGSIQEEGTIGWGGGSSGWEPADYCILGERCFGHYFTCHHLETSAEILNRRTFCVWSLCHIGNLYWRKWTCY